MIVEIIDQNQNYLKFDQQNLSNYQLINALLTFVDTLQRLEHDGQKFCYRMQRRDDVTMRLI